MSATSSTDDARAGSAAGNTADRLVPMAAQLFRERGYASTSTRELAEALGITKAALYRHIKSKEDLLYEICVESLSSIESAVASTRDATPAESRLREMILTHVDSAVRKRDMHAVMLSELNQLTPARRKEIVAYRARYEKLLRDVVAEDQKAGRLRDDIDAKYLTLALLNILNWSIFWFDPEGDLDPVDLATVLGKIYTDGIRV